MMPREALRRVGEFGRGAQLRGLLHGAPTKTSYVVARGRERFVLRVDRPLAARLGLDRVTEFEALRAASRIGAAPEPLALSATPPAVLLLRYAPGQSWRAADLGEPRLLERLATTLRRVHSLEPAMPALNLQTALVRYADIAGESADRVLAGKAAALAAALRAEAPPLCLCHHDPICANVIGRRRTVLIDWEYAALGDPLFDLAVVVRHHRLEKRRAARFAAAYFGSSAAVPWRRLDAMGGLYDLVAGLWLRAVRASGSSAA